VGQHSYPGDFIGYRRDLEYDEAHKGEPGGKLPRPLACGLSYNAFGADPVQAFVDPPEWMDGAKPIQLEIGPYTACTWCFERMYSDDVKAPEDSRASWDHNKRFESARQYFSQFKPGKSLVFYSVGYSNPFSEEEKDKYVVVGVSRIKSVGDFFYFDSASEKIRKQYANGVMWQKPITSCYPSEGVRIPLEKYMNAPEILSKITLVPENSSVLKFASREVTDDDAIELVLRFIEIVNVLIEIGDETENWHLRLEWLNGLLGELWKTRGPYPGIPAVLNILGLNAVSGEYVSLTKIDDMKDYYSKIRDVISGTGCQIGEKQYTEKELGKIRRNFKLMDDDAQTLLLDIFPRIDLKEQQMRSILDDKRGNVSISSPLEKIIKNPYIIFEQYVGYDADDVIPFYKIDNGILPSPEFGLRDINELDAGAPERFRALCVDELNKIAAHSFGKAQSIINGINLRLERMADWKKYNYTFKSLKEDFDILSEALHIREDKNDEKYLYLKTVYDNERIIEKELRRLADLPDISLKKHISEEKFRKELINETSKLLYFAKDEYERIIERQAKICMQIFNKPLSVLSGAAGTGKTTVIGSIIKNIRNIHGQNTEVLILTPTGKASERVKKQTSEKSSTIHSFLAKYGWINDNFTFRQRGAKVPDVNTIIIDECSMIDLNLFAVLIRAINWNGVQRLILIGDPNQLPPIGRGRVFADTIDWLKSEYPDNIGVLTENIRQLRNTVEGNGTGILRLADVFIQEKQHDNEELKVKKEELFGDFDEEVDKDLSVYFWKDKDELEDFMKNKLTAYMEKEIGKSCDEAGGIDKLWRATLTDKEEKRLQPERIQFISPYKGDFYGTLSINLFAQKLLNGNLYKQYSIDNIRVYDKVIQIKNRTPSNPAFAYNCSSKKTEAVEIYNGEIGFAGIHTLDKDDFKAINGKRKLQRIERFQVQFSGSTRKDYLYNYGKNLEKDSNGHFIRKQPPEENLELAYAISVHKAQGSEFDAVFIVLPNRDSHLLSMELLYTAITRAQKKVFLLVQDDLGTLLRLCRVEKSAVRRINSSVFNFNPLAEDFLYFNTWYKEGKKLATLTEYLVRSKSEVIIANLLFHDEIPFEYETPLYAPDGSMYLPDFTVSFRGEKYYWEHVGMLHDSAYKNHWEEKKAWYDKHFPNRLITTCESNDLTKNAQNIINKYK